MTTEWISAEELSQRFVIGAQRLAAYSRRGDLPARIGPNGLALYDGTYAATLFRRRGASLLASTTTHLGVLGKATLGAPPALLSETSQAA